MSKAIVEKNQKVTFSYSLWDSNGVLIESDSDNPPISYLHGYGHILEGLEAVLEGRFEGDRFEVALSCEQAFGPHDDELVINVPFKDLADIAELKIGMEIEIFEEPFDLLENRKNKDMFWTPSSPEDLFGSDETDFEDEDEEEDDTLEPEIFIVKEINMDHVILDGNPPLAGKDLVFKIFIEGIEPASFEEIEEQYLNDDTEDLF